WRQTGDTITESLFAHADARGGFFTLILDPPQRGPAAGGPDMASAVSRNLAPTQAAGSAFEIRNPQSAIRNDTALPRELIFVLDTSGSMSGLPIDKAKVLMSKAIDAMRDGDTFNMITFSGDEHILWNEPRPN